MLVRERHSHRITQWTLCRVRAHMMPNHRRAHRMQLVGPLLSEEEQPDKFEDYVAPEVDPAGDAAAPDAAAPAASVAPPQVTRVATAPQLIKAVAAGDRDILITDHIDLSNLPTDDLGFIMAVLPTTRSIRVRADTTSHHKPAVAGRLADDCNSRRPPTPQRRSDRGPTARLPLPHLRDPHPPCLSVAVSDACVHSPPWAVNTPEPGTQSCRLPHA